MSNVYSAEEVAKVLLGNLLAGISEVTHRPFFDRQHNKDGDLWVIIDAKVFDLSKFAKLHPGGRTVLLDQDVAGKDATTTFFGLHRHEVLLTPRYARLQIGTLQGSKESIVAPKPGDISAVPYGEPTWLTPGYYSPYYKDTHRKLQGFMRKFVDEIVIPDAQAREEDGKRPSLNVIDECSYVHFHTSLQWPVLIHASYSKYNIHAMRLGPGKHLAGFTLAGGIVKPEEVSNRRSLFSTRKVSTIAIEFSLLSLIISMN